MLNAAVVVDDWKLSIFKKNLDDASYSFEECPGPIKGTSILKVKTKSEGALKTTINKANAECAKWKRNKLN